MDIDREKQAAKIVSEMQKMFEESLAEDIEQAKREEREKIAKWIDEHNACSIEHGLNIGSTTWQPFRQALRGE